MGKRLHLGAGAAALGLGIAGIALFASQVDPFLSVLASGLLFAAAAFAAASLLGFLFGVPRTLTSEQGGVVDGALRGRIMANTNLEQVSDWLTKILIGVTLVQLSHVPSGAARLFNAMAPSLGAQDSSAATAGAIVIYFAALGFLTGWLLTRLFLGRAMRNADGLEQAAVVLEAQGKMDEAAVVREAARSSALS